MNIYNCSGLFINIFSIASAINSCFVRSEKINELFCFNQESCKNDAHENKLGNLIFSLLNVLAVTPEVIHNTKMNADLRNIFRKLNVIGKTEHCATAFALLLTSTPVAVGHGFMFYDANANMFKDTYKIEITEHQTNWPFWFSGFFAVLGTMQHWLHGSMELAEGAHHDPSIPLFYSSHRTEEDGRQQRMVKLITQDIGINVLLSLAVLAEFGLFYTEFNHQITENSEHLSKVSQAFLALMSISFSCISASMYLGHEGQSFLKMDKFVKKISKDYHNLSIKKLFQKQLHLLSCLSHAIVHGVTRYQVLQILKFPFAISLMSASVSGLSRLNMLGMDEEEDKEKDNEEEHLPPGSIHYDACERGKDVMYETFFIMMIALLYLYEHQEPSSQQERGEILPWHVAGACSLSELLGELTMRLASCCLKRRHILNPADFLINTVTTPVLSGYIVQELGLHVFDDSLMNLAAQILMLSLALRYGQKKLWSYPERIIVQDGVIACGKAIKDKSIECADAARDQLTSYVNSFRNWDWRGSLFRNSRQRSAADAAAEESPLLQPPPISAQTSWWDSVTRSASACYARLFSRSTARSNQNVPLAAAAPPRGEEFAAAVNAI